MFGAFTARRPWAAALIAFVFDPFVGMLYLGRGGFAMFYLFAEFAATLAIFLISGPQGRTVESDILFWGAMLAFRIVGGAHAYVAATGEHVVFYRRWYARWYAIVGIVAVLYGLMHGARVLVYQPFNAVTMSMAPTLNPGDAFFVSKFAYRSRDPQRGDLVVFTVAGHGGVKYIKRVVGMPGDRIQMVAGALRINGVPVRMRRIEDALEGCGRLICTARQYQETLPGGHAYRVLDLIRNSPGDNTPVFVVPAGHYFVLGDNRDDSLDSRMGLGFVSRDAIVGKVVVKYWDGNRKRADFEPVP